MNKINTYVWYLYSSVEDTRYSLCPYRPAPHTWVRGSHWCWRRRRRYGYKFSREISYHRHTWHCTSSILSNRTIYTMCTMFDRNFRCRSLWILLKKGNSIYFLLNIWYIIDLTFRTTLTNKKTYRPHLQNHTNTQENSIYLTFRTTLTHKKTLYNTYEHKL